MLVLQMGARRSLPPPSISKRAVQTNHFLFQPRKRASPALYSSLATLVSSKIIEADSRPIKCTITFGKSDLQGRRR